MSRPRTESTYTGTSDLQPLYISEDGPKQSHKIKTFFSGNPGIFVGLVCAIIIGSLIGFVIKCALIRLGPVDAPRHVGVETTCGYVSGKVDDTVFVFRGIPYADPPKRWQPPVSMSEAGTCWGGVRDATRATPSCFQYNEEVQQYEGSENCLYANIWTPQIDPAAMLDVMVYIHGGGLMTGSGTEAGSSPSPELATNYNKVFVSFNYRLNAFGFLSLDALSRKSGEGASGNYGLMDQVAALRWVHDNIHWFGGDKNKVTVFGDGSGATSILALLALQESQGLFHRAWLISPSARMDVSVQQAQLQNAGFINNTGCYSTNPDLVYDCLMLLTPEKVVAGLPWKQWKNEHFRDLPEVGEQSVGLFTVGGSAAQEVDDLPMPSDLGAWNFTTYQRYVHSKLDPFSTSLARTVLTLYGHDYTPEYQLTSMVSDLRAICPLNDLLVVAAAKFQAPVYRYMVQRFPDREIESENGAMYAFHGVDLYAFFDTLSNFAESTSEADMKFKQVVKNTVLEFVHSGKLDGWQMFPTGLTVLSETRDFMEQYMKDKCDYWKVKGLCPKFSWMN